MNNEQSTQAGANFLANDQIAAGAAIECDHGAPIGRNVAIDVFDAMRAAAPVAAQARNRSALLEEQIDDVWNSLAGFKVHTGQCLSDWNRSLRVAFARAIEREVAAQAGQVARPDELHDAIMRLPCKPGRAISVNGASLQAYKEGHRDARHAAADLAAGAEAGQVAVPDEILLAELRRWSGDAPGYAAQLVRGAVREIERLASAPSAPAVAQQAPAQAAPAASQITDTTSARKFVDDWHRKHFPTDRTFSRYIMADPARSNPLAGDFAWQLAKALESLGFGAQASTPDVRQEGGAA